jgi:hypothetical protein
MDFGDLVPAYSDKDPITFRKLSFDRRHTFMGFADVERNESFTSLHEAFHRVIEEYGQNLAYTYVDMYQSGNVGLQLGVTGVNDPAYAIASIGTGGINERFL